MSHDPCPEFPEYSTASSALDNLPFVLMVVLGVGMLRLSITDSPAGWIWAGLYVLAGALGVLNVMLRLCPYCPSYGKRSCPCGYGVIAAKLHRAGDPKAFAGRFRGGILPLVPLWFIPPIAALVALFYVFSWVLAILLAAFLLVGFVIIPVLSHQHGCKQCPQREACPWAGRTKPPVGGEAVEGSGGHLS